MAIMVNIYWDDYKTNNMMSVTKYFKWEYLLLSLIIYVSDDTVLFGTNNNEIYIYVKYAILLCVFALLFFKNNALDRKSTRLNSSHVKRSRMPSSA